MNRSSQPLVSIVTPVYNGAEYLEECIESVLAQTYQNWNYTIVDNCSTDGSAAIAHRYAARDARIRVHENQTFLQVIPNHNAALRQISPDAKYCKVVFADDWIFPECLEKMVAIAERHPTAGFVSAYCLEGREVTCTGLPYSTTMISGLELGRRTFLNRLYLFGSANCLLYRADLVRAQQPFYNESNIHADTEACFGLLRISDLAFVHQVLTFTRTREGSLTAMSQDLRTYLGGMLHVLINYGPHFLTTDEYQALMRQQLSEYYRFLASSLFRGGDRKTWDYHKQQLADAGVGFSRARLAQAVVANLGRAALSPRGTLEKLFTALRRSGPARGGS
jgi:glycosyltransferase involved in cell wall biosynthesis